MMATTATMPAKRQLQLWKQGKSNVYIDYDSDDSVSGSFCTLHYFFSWSFVKVDVIVVAASSPNKRFHAELKKRLTHIRTIRHKRLSHV